MIHRSHFILFVQNQADSRRFYEVVLQLEPVLDAPGMTEFQLDARTVLGIMPVDAIRRVLGPALPDPAIGHGAPRSELYLQVDEPQACHTRALENGARELSPMAVRSWGHEVAYSLDPDGHVLAFARAGSSS